MGKLVSKDKEIVVPGEELAQGMDYLPGQGTFRDKEAIVASRLGLLSVDGRALKIIPLTGRYLPKKDDTIIAQVTDVTMNGWRLDTNSAYSAMIGLKDATSEFIPRGADLTQYFSFGDYVVAKIINVTSQKLIDLSMKGPGLMKLHGGRVIKVNTHKVPRIIGKQGSMVSLIKNATGCKMIIGQNGLAWIDGEPENELIVVEAIRKIEKESHISGLTDRIKEFLEKKTGNKVQPAGEQNDQNR
ncbi:RNA-binding protein [Candidatus Woesearchaeota archaeon]|nr:RNA-binding protein [Candidatus Woesearchaeota archaeon]